MRPIGRRQDKASCFNSGHARVLCACGRVIYECACGLSAVEKADWFAMHPTHVTTSEQPCRICRPVAPVERRERTRRRLRTMPDRQADARQTTRRK